MKEEQIYNYCRCERIKRAQDMRCCGVCGEVDPTTYNSRHTVACAMRQQMEKR